MLKRRQDEWQRIEAARIETETAQRQQAEMEDLARRDPDGFSERYLKYRQQQRDDEKEAERVAQIRSQTEVEARQSLASQIGEAVKAIPGFQATDEQRQQIFLKLQERIATGQLTEHQVVAAFLGEVADLVADQRSRAKDDAWREAERKAILASTAAGNFSASPPVDGGRVRGNGTYSDEPDFRLEPRKWEQWYRANTGVRR